MGKQHGDRTVAIGMHVPDVGYHRILDGDKADALRQVRPAGMGDASPQRWFEAATTIALCSAHGRCAAAKTPARPPLAGGIAAMAVVLVY
jgi:hypothetical protein